MNKWIFYFLVLAGIGGNAWAQNVEVLLRTDLFLAQKTDFEFKKWMKGAKISAPPATWILLLKNTLNEEYKESCLFYRPGELRLVRRANCTQNYENPMASEEHEQKESLEMSFNEKDSILLMNIGAKSLSFDVPTFKSRQNSFELLSDGSPEAKLSYISISGTSPLKSTRKLVGMFSDNYRDGSAELCHQVDRSCQNVTEDTCSDCRYGWYEVVDHHCPQGGSKYCGVNRCGDQGQPACPRGEIAASRLLGEGEILEWCSKDSVAGFCQQGLSPHCDGNGVLICL